MSKTYKKTIRARDLPEGVGQETIATISRIEAHLSVAGILFVRHNLVHICTVPETMAQTLVTKLPTMTRSIHHALTEIDIADELIAYRIETKTNEILVAPGKDFTACVIHSIRKHKRKGKKQEK